MREDLRSSFETKDWSLGTDKSKSGPGSDMDYTARLRAALPGVLERYQVKRFVDAPCGDWFWMQHVDLGGIDYIGGDISQSLVEENARRFGNSGARFIHLDITSDPLPECDLLMCRDCLFHLKFWLRWRFLENFAASKIPYLMTTMHHVDRNPRLKRNGAFARFNPMVAPFNFPAPLELITETTDTPVTTLISKGEDVSQHRSLGIWSHDQISAVLAARVTE